MDTQNSQKKSPRNSAKSKPDRSGRPDGGKPDFEDDEQYMDYSMDHVARVRRAREAAQRQMESFGDASEYDITIIRGELKEAPPEPPTQSKLEFEDEVPAEQKEND